MCERCWGKAFTAAYGIGSKTQAGEYERIVATCACTQAQRLGVADSFAEGYKARLAEDAKVRAQLVEALEAAKAWMNNGPQLRSECMAQIDAALAALASQEQRRIVEAKISVLEDLQRSMRKQPSNYLAAASVWCMTTIARLRKEIA